jgi:hypothetical protein
MSEWDNFDVDGVVLQEDMLPSILSKAGKLTSGLMSGLSSQPFTVNVTEGVNYGIDKLLSDASSLVKPSRYMVRIGGTDYILAHTVGLPSRTIQTRNDDNYVVGRTLKTAYATDIAQLTIQFYTSYDSKLQLNDNLVFFDEWMAGTLKHSVVYNKPDGNSENYANYADQYTKDIEVDLISDDGTIINTWTIIGAYPTAISHDELSYSNVSAMLGVTVTFDATDMVANAAHDGHGDLIDMISGSSSNPFMTDIVTSVTGIGSNISGYLPEGLKDSFGDLSVSGFGTTPGEGEAPRDWLGELKQGYLSAKDSVSGFLGGANEVLDSRVMDVAKTMATKFVAAKINGTKFDAGGELRKAAAPAIGSVIGGLTQDPALSKVLNRQSQNIILGMPNATSAYAKSVAIKELQTLIGNVPSKPIKPVKPF